MRLCNHGKVLYYLNSTVFPRRKRARMLAKSLRQLVTIDSCQLLSNAFAKKKVGPINRAYAWWLFSCEYSFHFCCFRISFLINFHIFTLKARLTGETSLSSVNMNDGYSRARECDPMNCFRECTANPKILSTYHSSVPRPSVVHRCFHSTLERIQNQTKRDQHVLTDRKSLGRMVSAVENWDREKNGWDI